MGSEGVWSTLLARIIVVSLSAMPALLTKQPLIPFFGVKESLSTWEHSRGTFGDANSINDAGTVTGHAANPDNSVHGFLWKKGGLTDIGTVNGDDCSAGFSINSADQIVGQSFACDGSVSHAFLWENGKIIDLNSLVSNGSDLQMQVAGTINNRGEIAGFGVLPNGDRHAFLLVPCDGGHHGVESCDYSMAEASATAPLEPTIHATPGPLGRRPPIALWQPGNRFHFRRPVIGRTK